MRKRGSRKFGVFGPRADEIVSSLGTARWLRTLNADGQNLSLIPISSDASWGKASDHLVNAAYQEHVLAVIAMDRPSSHLAEQIAVKAFVPVVAISSDRALTSTNIPWIFRLPDRTSLEQALECLSAAITEAGPNRGKICELLSSGANLAGIGFESTGEPRKPTVASRHR